MYGNYSINHGNDVNKYNHSRAVAAPRENTGNLFSKGMQLSPLNNKQFSFANLIHLLLISLLQQLLNQFSNQDTTNNPVDSSTPSVTADPVNIAGGATIGQRAGSWSGNTFNPGQIIDNAEIVDIGGQSYSIGALKSQAEAYNQSDFVPQGVITSLAANAAWGVGSPAGIAAFENYMLTHFPNGLI